MPPGPPGRHISIKNSPTDLHIPNISSSIFFVYFQHTLFGVSAGVILPLRVLQYKMSWALLCTVCVLLECVHNLCIGILI